MLGDFDSIMLTVVDNQFSDIEVNSYPKTKTGILPFLTWYERILKARMNTSRVSFETHWLYTWNLNFYMPVCVGAVGHSFTFLPGLSVSGFLLSVDLRAALADVSLSPSIFLSLSVGLSAPIFLHACPYICLCACLSLWSGQQRWTVGGGKKMREEKILDRNE